MPYISGTAQNFEHLHDLMVKFLAGYGVVNSINFVGDGNGEIIDLDTTELCVTESWTITCVSLTEFSVVSSVSGAEQNAEIGKIHINSKISFTIIAGATPFSIGDAFTIEVSAGTMPEPERWQVIRYTGILNIAASSFLVNHEPWRVVKGAYHGHTNGWATATGQITNEWVSWKFVKPFEVFRLSLQGSPTLAQSPNTFSLQYSDDGVNWQILQSWSGVVWTASETKQFTITEPSVGRKLYWRLFVNSNNGNTSNIYVQRISFPEFIFTADFNHSRRPSSWLKAPGLTGLDPCYINTQLYDRPTDDYFNMAFTGATGFLGAADFDNQPGARAALAIPLWNQQIPYWIAGNGQRVILSAKIDTTYVSMYAGKIMTFGTPGQFPYPLVLGGPLPTASGTRYSNAAVATPFKGNRSQLVLRNTVGTWIAPHAWPYTKSDGDVYTFRDVAGAYCLLPITLHDASNTYGVLDGVQFVTGFGNAVENTVTIDSEEWLVIQDATRNGLNDFYAQRVI